MSNQELLYLICLEWVNEGGAGQDIIAIIFCPPPPKKKKKNKKIECLYGSRKGVG